MGKNESTVAGRTAKWITDFGGDEARVSFDARPAFEAPPERAGGVPVYSQASFVAGDTQRGIAGWFESEQSAEETIKTFCADAMRPDLIPSTRDEIVAAAKAAAAFLARLENGTVRTFARSLQGR